MVEFLQFLRNVANEAYMGNFSFAILVVNILQLIVGIIAIIVNKKRKG